MDRITQIEDYVRELSADLDEMHDYSHFKTVADNAAMIAQAEGYDEQAAYIAGMLHDVGRIKYKGKWVRETDGRNHGILSAEMAKELLTSLEYEKIDEVCEAIAFHVRPRTQKSELARILWDADKLCFYSVETGDKLVRFLVNRGMSPEKAIARSKHDWSFYYQLFYTDTARKRAMAFLDSIGEPLVPVDSLEWEAPSVLAAEETPFPETT